MNDAMSVTVEDVFSMAEKLGLCDKLDDGRYLAHPGHEYDMATFLLVNYARIDPGPNLVTRQACQLISYLLGGYRDVQ